VVSWRNLLTAELKALKTFSRASRVFFYLYARIPAQTQAEIALLEKIVNLFTTPVLNIFFMLF
jgi:Ser/Thr protein kinase RdoA (MazF antagonist)